MSDLDQLIGKTVAEVEEEISQMGYRTKAKLTFTDGTSTEFWGPDGLEWSTESPE